MKIVVLDTNILIDYANGYASWIDEVLTRLRDTAKLILPTIVLAEYFTSEEFEKKEKVVIADKTFMEFDKQDLTEDIAKILGTILRRKIYSQGASLADLIIAATTLHLDAVLATRNQKDFAKIPHLRFFDSKSIVI